MPKNNLLELAKLIRYYILKSTTTAGSGHPTSSLSATDLMTTLMFGGFFRANLDDPDYINNDRLIFSKGHAAPLFYSLYATAGKVSEEELMTLRKFSSRLEGHPTMEFPYTEAATGSLGQGLSIGVGMALNAKLDKLSYKTFVLLGDSEMAEGNVWEALEIAAHYKLDNLIGIIDVNRLGQRGVTMYGHKMKEYEKRIAAFGWKTIVLDGHNFGHIQKAFKKALRQKGRPIMIIAKTLKGRGVKLWENKENWHSKTLDKEQLAVALKGLGKIDTTVRGAVVEPTKLKLKNEKIKHVTTSATYTIGEMISTKKAYGEALTKLYSQFSHIVSLDAEVSNSTHAEIFKKAYPKQFFEMYIAEQNMVGAALGFSRRGKIPFVSTFAAFLTRAHDQIRMSQFSDSNIKFVGSYAGVSLGMDGSSQMGLDDVAMFRSMLGMSVVQPADGAATQKLVKIAAEHNGNMYIRTARQETPVIYSPDEEFELGGSKTVRSSSQDVATIMSAGVTLHEALKAYDILKKENIMIRVVDLYSIKPLDGAVLEKAARETGKIITVEDHYAEGGIGEAVASALCELRTIGYELHVMAVRKMPRSGKPEELLRYEEIDAEAIVRAVRRLVGLEQVMHSPNS